VQAKAPARLIEGGMVRPRWSVISRWRNTGGIQRSTVKCKSFPVRRAGQPADPGAVDEASRLVVKGFMSFNCGSCTQIPAVLRRDAYSRPRSRTGRSKICQFWAHAVDDRPWNGPRRRPWLMSLRQAAARRKSPINSRFLRHPASRRLCRLQGD